MARPPADLPRMETQAKSRNAPAPPAPSIVPSADPVAKPAKPMMRQYDLVERVRKYNPDTDEGLLNRAYVYAMKAHGEQKRASGDPYFSHPLEVAAILTDHKLDDATIAAALLHEPSRTPRRPAPRSTSCSARTSAIWWRVLPSSRS